MLSAARFVFAWLARGDRCSWTCNNVVCGMWVWHSGGPLICPSGGAPMSQRMDERVGVLLCVCVGGRSELERRVSEAFLFALFYCKHLCGALLCVFIKRYISPKKWKFIYSSSCVYHHKTRPTYTCLFFVKCKTLIQFSVFYMPFHVFRFSFISPSIESLSLSLSLCVSLWNLSVFISVHIDWQTLLGPQWLSAGWVSIPDLPLN